MASNLQFLQNHWIGKRKAVKGSVPKKVVQEVRDIEPILGSDYEDDFDMKSQATFSELIRKPKITTARRNHCSFLSKVMEDPTLPTTSDLGDDPTDYVVSLTISIPSFASVIKCGTSNSWIGS